MKAERWKSGRCKTDGVGHLTERRTGDWGTDRGILVGEGWQTGNEVDPIVTLDSEVGKRKAPNIVHEDQDITHSSPGKSTEPPNISPKMHPADQRSEAMDGPVGSLVACYTMAGLLDVLVDN